LRSSHCEIVHHTLWLTADSSVSSEYTAVIETNLFITSGDLRLHETVSIMIIDGEHTLINYRS